MLTSKPWIIAGLSLVVFGIAVKFLIRYALPYFRFDQAYFDQFGYWPHRGRLILHICGAMLALICGPFQFWTGLRQIALSFHRWTGRLYLVGLLWARRERFSCPSTPSRTASELP
jgi:hypothetical protein